MVCTELDLAWEVTEEDVISALEAMGVPTVDDAFVGQAISVVFDLRSRVQNAVLDYFEMEEQCVAAEREIISILRESGFAAEAEPCL